MPENEQPEDLNGGKVDWPEPDPWAPPNANMVQLTGILMGGAGTVTVASSQQTSGPDGASMLGLLDPAQLLSSLSNVLGFAFDARDAINLGLLLLFVSLGLNILSYGMRLQHRRAEVLRRQQQRDAQQVATSTTRSARG